MNRWILTDEIKNKYLPIISEFMNKLYNMTPEDVENTKFEDFTLQLSDTKLRPYTLLKLMEEEFGYTEHDFDDNGWELDYWIILNKPNCSYPSYAQKMCIHGCGMTFELNLSPYEFIG